MKKIEYKQRLLESCFLLITIVLLLFLYTFKGALLYKIQNGDIKNEDGFLYFHNYYGETNGKDFESQFTQKEQNRLLKDLLLALNQSKYDYLLDFRLGIEGVNTIIVNNNTINYFDLNSAIEDGSMIEGEIYVNDKEIIVPVLIGFDLKDRYKLGDIIEVNIYNTQIKYIVKGVMSKNTKLDFEYFCEGLDDLIIVPQINFMNQAETREEYRLQNYILYYQCNGYFRYNKRVSYEEIKRFCDDISIEYGIQWKVSDKIENKLEGVDIPIGKRFIIIGIIFIYIIMGIVQFTLFYILNKAHSDSKYQLIKIQTKHTLQTICIGYVIYEISLKIVKAKLCKTVYYTFLMENRVYTIIYIIVHIITSEVVYWNVLNKNRKE